MKVKKILLVSHHWPTSSHHSKSSGYERLASYLTNDCQVEVLTAGPKNQTLVENNLTIHFRKTPVSNFFFEKRLNLAWQAKKMAEDYDLVHCLYSDVGYFFTKQDKVIMTEHDLPEINPSAWMKYKSIIQKPTLKKARLVIAVSSNLKKIIKQKYNQNTIYIPHGIDTKIFMPTPANQVKKQKLLNKRFKFICLSVGIQGVNSGVFQQTTRKFPEILFIVIGRKEKNNKLNNVYLPGKISEEKLKEFYSMADFCFKPLKFATANNAILEAMAMGKASITNKIPGITDYLNNNCAYLAKNNEVFPDLFNRAMTNKKEREKKERDARKRAEQEFSWEIVAEKISQVYQKTLKDKK